MTVGVLESVNVGEARSLGTRDGLTGIDKRPVTGPVALDVPRTGASGVAGDVICHTRVHGGPDAAVYAYAREDLDAWEADLGPLHSGVFGENITTRGLDVTGALVGERWRIGEVVLQVTDPRIPCAIFAAWLDRKGWIRTFTERAVPGAYLRIVEPGEIRAGDEVVVEHRPDHDVSIGVVFRALTGQPELLPRLLTAAELPDGTRQKALRRTT
jgi:MOSC domain-containing protein YiiM